MVSQDEPLIEIFHRDSPEPRSSWRYFFADELAGTIRIPSIDCELRLAEVYDRIVFPAYEEEDLEETIPDE